MSPTERKPLRGPLFFGEGAALYWFEYEAGIPVNGAVLRYFLSSAYFHANRCTLSRDTDTREGWDLRVSMYGKWNLQRHLFIPSKAEGFPELGSVFTRAELYYGNLVRRYSRAWFRPS